MTIRLIECDEQEVSKLSFVQVFLFPLAGKSIKIKLFNEMPIIFVCGFQCYVHEWDGSAIVFWKNLHFEILCHSR